MVWDWQVWRCFDDVGETLEARGWASKIPGRVDNDVMPLAAESEGCVITFVGIDSNTGECWFELRDRDRPPVVLLEGAHNVPTPEGASALLADHGATLREASATHDRPLYEPPMAEAG